MLDKIDETADPYARAQPSTPLRRMGEEFLLALTLLTRIPVPRFRIETPADLGSAFWAYPLVGALVGAIGAAAFAAAEFAHLSGMPAIVLAIAAMVIATGAFHEDGFADFWDGVGGGATRRQKLEIMRDSRLGTYGAMALLIMFALTLALLVNLNFNLRQHAAPISEAMAGVLIATGALQRAAIGVPLLFLGPARKDGLAADTPSPGFMRIALGLAIAYVLSAILLGVLPALYAFLAALAAAAIVAVVSAHYLGGRTGDALGSAASLAGLFVLAVLAALTASVGQ